MNVPVVLKQILMKMYRGGRDLWISQFSSVTKIGLVVTSTVDFVIDVVSTELIHSQKCKARHRDQITIKRTEV